MQLNRYQAVRRVNVVSALVNLLQAFLKMLFGAIGGSPALFADGVHSLADLLSNALVWIASKIGHAPPDFDHPYGHGRIETFGSFILGLILLITAISIGWSAVLRILAREVVEPHIVTLVIAVISILLNESIFGYSMRVAKKIHSSLLKANAYHSRSDSLSSLIVVIGILGQLAGLHFADAIATLFVAVFIIKIGLELAWHAVEELTDRGIAADQIKAFEAIILNLSGVRQMHRLRTRKMRDRIFLDVHILIAPYASASEGHYIAETVHYHLKKKFAEIEDIVIHIDTEDHPEMVPERLMPNRREIEAVILPALHQALESQEGSLGLFYFRDWVELEFVLPFSALQKYPPAVWQTKITDMTQSIKEIKKASLRFKSDPAL